MAVQDYTSELQYTIWHYIQNNHCHRVAAHLLSNIVYILLYLHDALFVHRNMENKRHACRTAVSLQFLKLFLQPEAEDHRKGCFLLTRKFTHHRIGKTQTLMGVQCRQMRETTNISHVSDKEASYYMIRLAQQD